MSWEKVKLGDIATCIQPGPFGSQLHNSDYSELGTPIIMPKDMIDGKISHSNLIFVGEEHTKRLCRHQVHAGNLMVARKGDVRKCVFITENEDGWMTGSDCLKVALKENVCYPRFVYYQLRSPFIGRWLEKISIGATMPSINTGLLSSIELVLPPLKEQKRIADILSAYDDLIENNQKQIKLLEEAAQRLYKQWFIDLRFPGYETTPIVDGLPEGWHYGSITEISTCYDSKRKPLSSKERDQQEKVYPYYGAASLMDYVEKFIFDGVYLLFGEDGTVITSDETPMLQYVWGKFWVNNHAHIFQGANGYSTEFLYMLCKHMKIKDIVTGVAQPKISQGRLNDKKIVIPSRTMVAKYSELTQTFFKQIRLLNDAINMSKEARDRLLPKLVNGELEM